MRHAKHFNLIEILLTVAVIAFGVSVILGMLPRGLALTRSAGMESYASEIIDQMAGYMFELGVSGMSGLRDCSTETKEKDYIKAMLGSNDDTPTPLDKNIMKGYLKLIGSNDNGAVSTSENSDKVAEETSSCKFYRTGTAGVFRVDAGDGDTNKGIYVIVMGDYNNQSAAAERESRVDFSGMLRCWKRPLKVRALRQKTRPPTIDGTGAEAGWAEGYSKRDDEPPTSPGAFEAADPDDTYPTGAVLCMELSYPLTLPYAQRTKHYYSFEVPK